MNAAISSRDTSSDGRYWLCAGWVIPSSRRQRMSLKAKLLGSMSVNGSVPVSDGQGVSV